MLAGVTGGAGYLGGRLVPALRAAGWSVRVVDDLSGPVSAFGAGEGVLRSSYFEPPALRALADCDVILHLAAVSGVVACARDPALSASVNVRGLAALCELARERSVPIAFASSLAVVGVPDRWPVTEETRPRPPHAYAQQKAEGERQIGKLHEDGVPAAICRMSNLYGGYWVGARYVAKGNVVERFLDQAPEGRLSVFAPGTQRRDFVHLDDVVDLWIALARRLREGRRDPPVYLFARGRSYSIREAAELVAAAWRRVHPERPPPAVQLVENPRASVEILHPRFDVDPRRSWERLGLAPRHSLEEDLEGLIRAREPSPGASPAA